MEQYDKKAAFSELKAYCTHAKDHDFIEVTEWKNGEGFDVEIASAHLPQRFQLTHGGFKAMKKLIKKLTK